MKYSWKVKHECEAPKYSVYMSYDEETTYDVSEERRCNKRNCTEVHRSKDGFYYIKWIKKIIVDKGSTVEFEEIEKGEIEIPIDIVKSLYDDSKNE